MSIKTTTLGSTDLTVSTIGFGCVALGGQYGELEEAEGIRSVHHAIDVGINFFDTSAYYGETLSETRLGKALKGRRDQIVLATKGGRHTIDRFDFTYDNIIEMCDASLRRLQTDWLDVYQLHDIEFGRMADVEAGIRALQDLKKAGKVRAIGVTGYPLGLLRQMAATHDLDLVLSYCHGNLLNDRLNDVLLPTVRERGIGLINASITHMGILTPQGEQPWHPAAAELKQAGRAAANICLQYGANLAQLATQYALQTATADVTLLGTRTVAELDSTLALNDTPINPDLLRDVQTALAPVHNLEWPSGLPAYADPYP